MPARCTSSPQAAYHHYAQMVLVILLMEWCTLWYRFASRRSSARSYLSLRRKTELHQKLAGPPVGLAETLPHPSLDPIET